ncbi:MAG: hypothetical protein HUK03_02695, partial [Bacteroidaceae bacterium]|nr:hypothetical protein [Bacteroidaceae bacterium]
PSKVEWASQNMLVLGVIVILGMALHLYNFWWNMMAAELIQGEEAVNAANGVYWIVRTFSCPIYTAIYLVWLVALWFHLTHGFWSAMQTMGWSGKIWFERWRCIGTAYCTIVVLMFAAVAIAFCAGYRPADCPCCGQAEACTLTICEGCVEETTCCTPCACTDKTECTCEGECPCEACAEEVAPEAEHNHMDKAVHEDCKACEPMMQQGAAN